MKSLSARLAPWALIILGFAGLADSAYLAQSELSGTPLVCTIGSLTGCNIVAQSAYSYLFGIPLSVYGLAFYALVFVLAALELAWSSHMLRKALLTLTFFGIIVSAVSLFLQLFVIKALCIYCAFSWLVTLIAWLFARTLPDAKIWRKPLLTDPIT